MRYKEGYTGTLVGQLKEYPFIIVEGKTLNDLLHAATHELEVYLNTFKEDRKHFIKQFREELIHETSEIKTDEKEQEKEGWKEMKVEIPARR